MKKNLSYFGGSHHYVISSVLLVGQVGLIHLQLGWEIYLLYKWDEPPSSFDRTSRNDLISGPAATWIHLGHGVRSLAWISLPHDQWGTGILELLSRWSYQILCKSSIFAADIPRLVQQIPVLVETMHKPFLDHVFVDKYRSVSMKSTKNVKKHHRKSKLSEKP
jgi:hypothetical protein